MPDGWVRISSGLVPKALVMDRLDIMEAIIGMGANDKDSIDNILDLLMVKGTAREQLWAICALFTRDMTGFDDTVNVMNKALTAEPFKIPNGVVRLVFGAIMGGFQHMITGFEELMTDTRNSKNESS